MKILKEGKILPVQKEKRFGCTKCGCVFLANESEYKSGSQYNEVYYYCRCPCCKNTAYFV